MMRNNITKKCESKKLHDYIEKGVIQLTRGNVISKKDIADNPGQNPIYSSSIQRNGLFGVYGEYMFDEELITWSIDGGGNFFYRPRHKFSVTNVSGILRVDTTKFNYQFLAYFLEWEHRKFHFDYQTKAHPSVIRQLYFIIKPPLSIQKKIANILSIIDGAIQKTDKIIQGTEQLKKGLIDNLFSFRNEKDVKFMTLGDIGKVSMCKRIYKKETSDTGEIPFYKIGTFGKKPDAFISQDLFNNYRKKFSFPKVGDVLLSASGTIGRKIRYDGRPAYFQDSNIIWLEHDESKILNDYLFYLYETIEWQTEGSTIKRLYNNILLKKRVYVPSINNQKRIVAILSGVDEKILIDNKLKAKLIATKKGLMQDIFSQKVTIN